MPRRNRRAEVYRRTEAEDATLDGHLARLARAARPSSRRDDDEEDRAA